MFFNLFLINNARQFINHYAMTLSDLFYAKLTQHLPCIHFFLSVDFKIFLTNRLKNIQTMYVKTNTKMMQEAVEKVSFRIYDFPNSLLFSLYSMFKPRKVSQGGY